MSVDVVIPTAVTTGQEQKDAASIVGAETEQQLQEARMEKITVPTTDAILNVWSGHCIDTTHTQDEDYDSMYSSRKPSAVSSLEDQLQEEVTKPQNEDTKICRDDQILNLVRERESYQKAFEAATTLLEGIMEDNKRKSSDPMVARRHKETRRNVIDKQRCHSDCTGVSPLTIITTNNRSNLSDDTSSAMGGDSGIVDYVSSRQVDVMTNDSRFRSSVCSTTGLDHARSSLDHTRSSLDHAHSRTNGMTRTSSLDEGALTYFGQSKERNNPRGRRGRMTKHLSLSSMGGSSDCTLSSLFDQTSSSYSMATELLSSLGFGDFDSPQLIPDRFIPSNAESAKPSIMYEQTLLGISSLGGRSGCVAVEEPQVACSVASNEPQKEFLEQHNRHPLSGGVTVGGDSAGELDLPLGATADNFLSTKHFTPPRTPSPPALPPELEPFYYYQAPPEMLLHGYSRKLETVPEETASDLSPSPRWLSPRVSLDHSTYDVATGQLGASLSVSNRKRSLPNREGYRMSVESMLSEQDNSTVYFSITSYDDDIAREEREREEAARQVLPVDDSTPYRRRRKGVHGAPPELLTWLKDQRHSLINEDEEDIPWPFNEQAHIRRSLTEYQHKQRLSQGSSITIEDCSLSPPEGEDPFEGVFQRRFSINGPLLAPKLDQLEDLRRLSLPSKYGHHYRSSLLSQHPPSKGTALEQTIDEENISSPDFSDDELDQRIKSSTDISTDTNTDTKTDTDQYQHSTRLPPGMTRADVRELKREANVMRKELEIAKQKLHDSERVRVLEGEEHLRHATDTEEWLRSELWSKERKCRELEETLEGIKRDYKIMQQNQQMSIARAKEETRDSKDKEIMSLKHKLEEKNHEFREKATKLEDECRHLRAKENQLLKKANQQNAKNEIEELLKEVGRLKEQLRHEKQLMANANKEKAAEMKQLRSKAQLEKEEALKNQKDYLTKIHQNELTTIRQAVHQVSSGEREAKAPGRPVLMRSTSSHSPGKLDIVKKYQLERMEKEIQCKDAEIAQLKEQLKVLHKEHFVLQKEVAGKVGK